MFDNFIGEEPMRWDMAIPNREQFGSFWNGERLRFASLVLDESGRRW